MGSAAPQKGSSSVGARLVEIRGTKAQPARAEELGVHKNTYARWERDEVPVSTEAVATMVQEGWNANWVLTGEGPRRFEQLPQAVRDTHTIVLGLPGADEAEARRTADLKKMNSDWLDGYATGLEEAGKVGKAGSHAVSEEALTIALEFAERCMGKDGWLPRPLYARLVRLLYEGITQGLPVAEVLQLGRRTTKAMAQGEPDDSEPGVGTAG